MPAVFYTKQPARLDDVAKGREGIHNKLYIYMCKDTYVLDRQNNKNRAESKKMPKTLKTVEPLYILAQCFRMYILTKCLPTCEF